MQKISLINLHELTLDNIHVWPLWIRWSVIIVVSILLWLFAYIFDVRKQWNQLHTAKITVQQLQKELIKNQKQKNNLGVFDEVLLASDAISTLRKAGSLIMENKIYGLIAAPDGSVVVVKVGDVVGKEKMKVESIDEERIQLLSVVSGSFHLSSGRGRLHEVKAGEGE